MKTAAMIVVALAAASAQAADLAVRPTVRPAEAGGVEVGVTVDLIGLFTAKRPTRRVYTEQAVALWRPAYGQLIAANEAPGAVADVNAAVQAGETEAPMGAGAAIAAHFRRNAGKYIAGAAAAAVSGGIALYQDQKDKAESKPEKATIETAGNETDASNRPSNSPQVPVTVNTGDNSPANVNVTVSVMPPG